MTAFSISGHKKINIKDYSNNQQFDYFVTENFKSGKDIFLAPIGKLRKKYGCTHVRKKKRSNIKEETK